MSVYTVYTFESLAWVKTWFLTVLLTKTLVSGMPVLFGDHLQWHNLLMFCHAECPSLVERWKMSHFVWPSDNCITLIHSVSLWQVSWHICPSASSPRGNSLDSRERSHPAILSIWEHINFQKPWIGGSYPHMCLSVPFALHPPQWLSGLSSNIFPILLDIRNH